MPYVQRQISNLAEKYDQDLVMNGHVWAGVGHTFWSQLLNTAREDPEEDIDQIPIRFRVFGQKPQAAPFRRSASARRLYSIQGFQPDAAVRANASRLHLALIEKLSQGAARNTEHAGSFVGC